MEEDGVAVAHPASVGLAETAGHESADMEYDQAPSLEQLKVRGSGHYTCPHGKDCDRGGFVDGNVKVFKRNSEYRSVFCGIDVPVQVN
jgi:hypothetical protein